jgi:membrane-associated protease RseP (regulator of RpoE activity)
MILNHERSRFLVKATSFLGANPTCHFVKMEGRSTAKISIYGPQKKGIPGVDISGFNKWGEGLFARVGWEGRLKVHNITPGSPAYEAGLRDEDEILAIDGAAVKKLSAGQAWVRLSGDVAPLLPWKCGVRVAKTHPSSN